MTTQILPSVCPLDCPDTCSLNVTVEDNRVIDVRGSHANPFTNGVVCSKVIKSYPEFVHGKDRLTQPLKRVGPRDTGMYEPITWDQALDLVYEGFSKAIDRYGPQSILPFNYAGPHGELAGGSMDRRFFYKLGATQLNRGPLCGAVRGGAYASLFGTAPGMPPEQAEHADMIIIWGNNVSVSNLHFMRIVNKAKAKGAKVIVVDPKRTKIAEQSDFFLQIHPGTDVVLAMAIAAELERRNAHDMTFIGEWVSGYEEFMLEARKYTINDVEKTCRLSKNEFETVVSAYMNATNIAASFGNGIERGKSGGASLRAAMALQALTGNHGRLGAGVLAKPGAGVPKTQNLLHRTDLISENARTFNIVDVAAKILDENMRIPIAATMIFNHNPVLTHPDQVNLIKALMKEDLFIVGCDVVMTDSMKFADVILPAASHFEFDDIYGAYGQNYVQRAKPVIPCVGESLPNTEIFRRLAARFGFDDPLFKETDAQLMDSAMNGSDQRFNGISPSKIDVDAAIEMKTIEGADAIMCKTVIPTTTSGKIELFCQDYEDRFRSGVPKFLKMKQDLPFTLITPSSSKRTNSTFANCKESDGLEIIEINPLDAKERGISNGDKVLVWNDQAKVTFRAVITDATRPSVFYSPKCPNRDSSDTKFTANALISSHIRTDIEDGACYNETFVEILKSPNSNS